MRALPDFFDVLKSRRTVRSYTAEPMKERDLQELIDLAVLAPTGMGAQPWAFTVVINPQIMRRLNGIVLEFLRAPRMQQLLAMEGLQDWINGPSADIFYGAPALVVISGDTRAPSTTIDCQLAAENLFLAAHAKGLGTCYMGFLVMAAESPELQALVRIPEGHKLLAAAVVGHPALPPEGPPKRNPARVEWVR
jgi:nitroreductase